MKNIFYKLFSISLLGVCLMGCEDETKYLPLPQAVPFTMTVNNTTFVMGEKLVVDLDINPDKDGSEVLANEDFDIYFTAKTGTEDVSGVFKDFHNNFCFRLQSQYNNLSDFQRQNMRLSLSSSNTNYSFRLPPE